MLMKICGFCLIVGFIKAWILVSEVLQIRIFWCGKFQLDWPRYVQAYFGISGWWHLQPYYWPNLCEKSLPNYVIVLYMYKKIQADQWINLDVKMREKNQEQIPLLIYNLCVMFSFLFSFLLYKVYTSNKQIFDKENCSKHKLLYFFVFYNIKI